MIDKFDYDECPKSEVLKDAIDIEDMREKSKSLINYISDARKAANELKYPDECLHKIESCKSKVAVNNTLASYRRRIP